MERLGMGTQRVDERTVDDARSARRDLSDSQPMQRPRFLQLADVAEILNISAAQTYALVRSGELPAIKVGGRGQWRVEHEQLERYIARAYAETKRFVETHPFGRADAEMDVAELD